MSSDDYVIPEKYEFYEEEIRRLLDGTERNSTYLKSYIDQFYYLLQEAEKSHEESRKFLHGQNYVPPRSYGLSDYFPKALNYSFITFAFLTFENQLRVLANIMYDNMNLPANFHPYLKQKYRGGNFDKYLGFFADNVSLHYSKFRFWQQIDKLNKIRDCIVHLSGYLVDSRDRDDLEKTIQSRNYFASKEKAATRILYPSESYFEKGEVDIDTYEDRLVIGGYYCKTIVWYLESFMHELVYYSGVAIYAAWDF